jgi:hypothetical protein
VTWNTTQCEPVLHQSIGWEYSHDFGMQKKPAQLVGEYENMHMDDHT